MGDPHAFAAVVLSAVVESVSVPTPGFVALAFVGASGVPVAGAGFQPFVEPFAFVAGAFAQAAGAPDPVAVVSFALLVGVSAPTPHHGRFAAADSGGSA